MSQGSTTILWVHDHWNRLIDHKMLLEDNYYKVLETADGSDGLRLFVSQPVDVVILDDQMPGMNGAVVAAEMKLLKPHVPIMVLSAGGRLTKSKMKSVDTCLSNSQPPRILLSALRGLLEGGSGSFFWRWLDQWKGRNQEVRQWLS
jgi:CheY-like chemotaxis protein